MRRFVTIAVCIAALLPGIAFAQGEKFLQKSDIEGLDERFSVYDIDVSALGYDLVEARYASDNYIILNLINYTDGKGNDIGVVDFDGNWLIEPGEFSDIIGGEGDLLAAQKYMAGSYGYVNLEGEYVIPPEFEYAEGFHDGVALAGKDNYEGYIDKSGNFVKIFKNNGRYISSFSDGAAIVSQLIEENGEYLVNKFTVYDTDFNILFESSDYDHIAPFEDGLARAAKYDYKDMDNNKLVYLDKSGKEVQQFDMGSGYSYNNGRVVRSSSDDSGRAYLEITDIDSGKIKEIEGIFSVPIGDSFYLVAGMEQSEDENFMKIDLYSDSFEYVMQITEPEDLDVGKLSEKSVAIRCSDTKLMIFTDTKTENSSAEGKEYKAYAEIPEDDRTVIFKAGDNRADVDGAMVFIDDGDADVRTYIYNDRIMLPIRFIMETLPGYIVSWDEEKQMVTVSGEKQIKMVIGENEAEIYEFSKKENCYVTRRQEIDTPPVIENDRMFLPLRFVSEITGKDIYWDKRGIAVVGRDSLEDADADEYISKFGGALMDYADYPVIDGSTATIPLSQALTARALGIDDGQASLITNHTKTSNSFNRLINREADLLLSGGLNEDKINKAAEKGIELEAYVVAKEGFVFMLNGKNSVKNLTTQQIQDIYQGKITNWKELGGADSEIIPFQRNEDSGSQTIMKNVVMKDLEMIPPRKETLIDAMGGIVDAVAEFDNAENSIGYSVYYYFSEMHNRDEVALAAVDGVEPNNENIKEGKYPFIIDYCVMIRKDEPQDSPVRKLVDFLLSDEGAEIVKQAGFVSVR